MFYDRLFNTVENSRLKNKIQETTEREIAFLLDKDHCNLMDLAALLSPAAHTMLESLAEKARLITLKRFGKTVGLYAPLYISNECVNKCTYCGFNAENPISRKTLNQQEIIHEAHALYREGFKHVLLVSGESPRGASPEHIARTVRRLSTRFPSISIEVYPMDTPEYIMLGKNGVIGIAVYQETYNPAVYRQLHTGPKADYTYRLQTPERAGEAGFRHIGIGILGGLADFTLDVYYVALHAAYLMKRFWKAQISISLPRICKASGTFTPEHPVSERMLAQAFFALRIILPDVDLVLSTRERALFRNHMAGICITRMSAGSKTNPGGYAINADHLEQFDISDKRSPAQVADCLREMGRRAVWKDFDCSFLTS